MAGFSGSPPGLSTDPLWSASGDIVYATGDDASTVLGVGTGGHVLTVNCDSTLKWAAPSGASGPACSTDNAIARYCGTGGSTLLNSGVTINDSNVLSAAGLASTGTVTVGSDGSGADVTFYSATAGDNLTWDASCKVLNITGTNATTALNVADGNVVIADTLYFYDAGGEYISSNGSTLTITGTVALGTALDTAYGGTGLDCLTAGSVLIGNGSSDVTLVAMTTKGDLLGGDGAAAPRVLAVGSNCEVLTACSGEATGMKWAAASGGGLTACGALCFNRSASNTGGNPFARVKISNSNAITANTGTTQRITSLWVEEPNISESGGTVTNTSAIFVEGPATEGCNNWAINVDSGTSRMQHINATNGSAAKPAYHFNDCQGAGMFRAGSCLLNFATQGIERIRIKDAHFMLQETGNDKMNTGITINQACRDNEIFALKSSEVAHGATCASNGTETDTYFFIRKSNNTGGANLKAFQHTGTCHSTMRFEAFQKTAANTADIGCSSAIMYFQAMQICGDASSNVSDAGNLFSWHMRGSTRMLMKGDGDLHLVNTSLTALDDYPDALMGRIGRVGITSEDSCLRKTCGHLLEERPDLLQVLKDKRILIGEPGDPHLPNGFINVQRGITFGWDIGYQNWQQLTSQEKRIEELETWTRDPQKGGVVEGQKKKGLFGRIFKRKNQE